MTDYDVAKQIIREMADFYDTVWRDLGSEMRELRREFPDNDEAIRDVRHDRRTVAVKRNTLNDLLETLDELVSNRVNGIS